MQCPKCNAEHEDGDSAPLCTTCHDRACAGLSSEAQTLLELCVEDSDINELRSLARE
jgi:hypothetical protein